jgi:hypothetical protein
MLKNSCMDKYLREEKTRQPKTLGTSAFYPITKELHSFLIIDHP